MSAIGETDSTHRHVLWPRRRWAGTIDRMRNLGPLTTSDLGYGAMVLVNGMYGASDDERAIATLTHALDAGATLLDTADAYGGGTTRSSSAARSPAAATRRRWRPSGASSSTAAA
jgi:hypothetical protein